MNMEDKKVEKQAEAPPLPLKNTGLVFEEVVARLENAGAPEELMQAVKSSSRTMYSIERQLQKRSPIPGVEIVRDVQPDIKLRQGNTLVVTIGNEIIKFRESKGGISFDQVE